LDQSTTDSSAVLSWQLGICCPILNVSLETQVGTFKPLAARSPENFCLVRHGELQA
jgi:hypothetical protein